MTVAMLLKNCCESAFKTTNRSSTWSMSYLPLNFVNPVPSDIDIASGNGSRLKITHFTNESMKTLNRVSAKT